MIYLQDSEANLNIRGRNLRIYGSPWVPFFRNMAFNLMPAELEIACDKIPKNLDILITHGPPQGILDRSKSGHFLGCDLLLKAIRDKKPKVHAFGHIHDSHGRKKVDDILFVNAALCNDEDRLVYKPMLIVV